jgi:hypothetical protein
MRITTSIAHGHSGKHTLRAGGYLLLELILALVIFTVAIVGLARSANIGVKVVGSLSRENDIRLGLGSFLEEVRRKPLAEMEQSILDERLGVTFTSQVDELTLKNVSGTVLRDLYKLHVSALAEGQNAEEAEAVEVWVYKPRTESK